MIFEYQKESETINNFKFRKDGFLSVLCNSSGYVKVLNLKHKKILKYFKFSSNPIHGINISNTSSLIAAGDDDGNLKIYDFASE